MTYICNINKIKVHNLPFIYHYYACAFINNDDIFLAKIIHTPSSNKPWNNNLFKLLFPEFTINYNKWINLGGSKINNIENVFSEIGNSPAHFLRYTKNSIEIIDLFNKISNLFNKIDIYPNIDIKGNNIRFYMFNNNFFYKININYGYNVSICNRQPSHDFLLFLINIRDVFLRLNGKIVSEKKYQYIVFKFLNENTAINFLKIITYGTYSSIKNMIS